MQKRLLVILVPVLVVAASVLLTLVYSMSGSAGAPQEDARVMDPETYVRENISILSPEREVLGGTFHVIKIEAEDGHGVVHYEDGHNAFVADFTYEIDQHRGVLITSFFVR